MESKQEKTPEHQLSPEEEKVFTDMVLGLSKAVLQARNFGVESPMAKKVIEETYKLIEAATQMIGKVTFYVHESKLMFRGFALAERNPIVKRLISLFNKDRIISIRFLNNFSGSNFIDLLKILSKMPEEIAKAGGVEKLMEDQSISGVSINPVTYQLLEEDENVGHEKIEKEDIPGELAGKGHLEEADGETAFTDEDLTGKREGKVIIIDSDIKGLISMKKVLVNEGYAVATTRSGRVALEILKGVQVDLVLCVHNSEINGIGICENISQDFPNVVKILMLDEPDLSIVLKATNRVSLYKLVMKPWDTGKMSATVKFAATQRKLIISDELLSQEIKKREVALRKDMEKYGSEIKPE